jgi:D-aminoacyl-tRNA deacylase
MKAVIQRVSESKVIVEGKIIGEIKNGLCILLGVEESDSEEIIPKFVDKIINLRIFEDKEEKFNRSVLEENGSVLVVSQFTLFADCKRGRRPSFEKAANAIKGKELYKKVVEMFKIKGLKVETGEFGAKMELEIKNMGPVTIILDSKEI